MTLVLLGGGGHSSDVLSVVESLALSEANLYPVYVADDSWQMPERFEDRGEVKMVESVEAGARLGPFLVALGYPGSRRAVHDAAIAVGGSSAEAIVHSHATLGINVSLADGVVVMGQTWISANVTIGAHTHVGYGSTVGHDTTVGAFTSIMPSACIGGDITIGDDVLIGANSTVLQGVKVGDGSIVGAGAVVLKDVEPGTTVVGVPAVASQTKQGA